MAGVCFWRLGSEDNRLWSFYDQDLSDSALARKPIDFSKFSTVSLSNDVDYLGEGEILDVLATPEPGKIALELDTGDMLIAEQHYESLPSTFVIRQFGAAQKKLVLTFDDGPDPAIRPVFSIFWKRNTYPPPSSGGHQCRKQYSAGETGIPRWL